MSLSSTIRHKYNSLFLVNYKLRILVEQIIESSPKITTPKDGVACFILAKTHKTHGAVMKLIKLGLSEDADMLIRTLFDAYCIIAAVVKDETENTALKFLRFDDSVRVKMFNSLKSTPMYKEWFDERAMNPEPKDESFEEVEGRMAKWREEYGGEFRQRWHSGSTAGELADSVEVKKYFDTAYSLQSQLAHSLPRTMDLYTKDNGIELTIDASPKMRGTDISLVTAFNMLVFVVHKFNEHYKLGREQELEDLVTEWTKAVEESETSRV